MLIAVAALLVREGEMQFAAAKDRGWQTVPAASSPSAETHAAMVLDRQGQVWFLTTSGKVLVYAVDGRLLKTIATEYDSATMLAVDPGGHPWIGSPADQTVNVQADDGHWTPYRASSPMVALVVDGRGLGWVDTINGLYTIDTSQPDQKMVAAGPDRADPTHNLARIMAVDGAGRFWAMYDDGNLYETADGAQWTKTPTGLDAQATKDCLAFDAQSRPWVCSGGRILSMGADGQWQTHSLPSGLALHQYNFNSWAMDRVGNIWLGTTGAGLYELDNAGAWRVFTPDNSGLDAAQIQVLAVDRQGTVWADTGNNVYDLGASQPQAALGMDPRPGWRAAASVALLAGALLSVAALPGALQPGHLALFAIPFLGWSAADGLLGLWLHSFISGVDTSGGIVIYWSICGVPLVLIIHAAVLVALLRRNRWLSLGLASAVGMYVLGTLLIAPAGQAAMYALFLYPFYLPWPR